jgi:hypothetical protein
MSGCTIPSTYRTRHATVSLAIRRAWAEPGQTPGPDVTSAVPHHHGRGERDRGTTPRTGTQIAATLTVVQPDDQMITPWAQLRAGCQPRRSCLGRRGPRRRQTSVKEQRRGPEPHVRCSADPMLRDEVHPETDQAISARPPRTAERVRPPLPPGGADSYILSLLGSTPWTHSKECAQFTGELRLRPPNCDLWNAYEEDDTGNRACVPRCR